MEKEKNSIFAKGKRGIIFIGEFKGKKAAIKKQNPDSKALGRIENEAVFLKKLNKFKIGPKFYYFKKGELCMEFIEGELFQHYIRINVKKSILSVIKNVFNQLYIMDKLKINKEEMHHPKKHIIISKNQPVMIDFERCHFTEKPKNVSQFIQYITRSYISVLISEKDILVDAKINDLIKQYKSDYSKKSFDAILNCIN